MADYTARIAPFINVTFYVTSVWWEEPRNHRGLDIATPSSLGNVPVYSMCNGTVVHKDWDENGYGNYIIMKDSTTGMGFLYGHLHEPSNKNVGDTVQIGEQVGLEGTTGHSTGIHLHVEMQDISEHSWIFHASKETYTNPATFMGFPNEEGISIIYEGTPLPPTPPTPVPTQNKKKYKTPLIFTKRVDIYF